MNGGTTSSLLLHYHQRSKQHSYVKVMLDIRKRDIGYVNSPSYFFILTNMHNSSRTDQPYKKLE